MHRDLQKNRKLLVISDTNMVVTNEGVNAFDPVVTELNHLHEIFEETTWIGFKYEELTPALVPVDSSKINVILLKKVGGKTILDKIKIIANYPKMIAIIYKEVKKHTYIHARAPSNPAVIAMFLSFFFLKKQFWFKYAGTWVDKTSFIYSIQRKVLKKLALNSIITINGEYSKKKNILAFENPCLSIENREEGKKIIEEKTLGNKKNYCFVGNLNKNKGVDKILKAFSIINSEEIGTIHFVGNGEERTYLEHLSKQVTYDIVFHGYMDKESVKNIYANSHFIILPSMSEGFPKVIGEAMNYGTLPIVSNISCIQQYVVDSENGYLLDPNSTTDLLDKITKSLTLNHSEFRNWIEINYAIADKFTYFYYKNRIIKDVFKLNTID